jgi:hypothetical protein
LGTKLEELAAKYAFTTDKLSASAGQDLRPEIQDTVFKLGIGEVSNPVRIEAQYFISGMINLDMAEIMIKPTMKGYFLSNYISSLVFIIIAVAVLVGTAAKLISLDLPLAVGSLGKNPI